MLEIKGISLSYGARLVLDNFSAQTKGEEIVGIVGPNGCGKTSLIKVIAGVAKPKNGEVFLNGQNLVNMGNRKRAQIMAVVPQNALLPPTFSALDIVLMARTPHLKFLSWERKVDLDITRNAMEFTDTWKFADQPIGKLSGGERQLVLIARALAQDAPMLLFDEPTSDLDISHQTKIMDLISEIQNEKMGLVILALHDLTLAGRYCGKILMMKEGKMIHAGKPSEVLTTSNIRDVYGAETRILSHPVYHTPVVLPLSKSDLDTRDNSI